jgi:hypothetical protein
MISQHTTIGTVDLEWEVDPQAIGKLLRWARRRPQVLQADLEGMFSYFPHWMLVGIAQGRTARCHTCHAPAVPTAGAIRCPACGHELVADTLAWMGLMPALARPEPPFAARRSALQQAGFGEVSTPNGEYLLVPLSAFYPSEWPNTEPVIRYAPSWLRAIGLPTASGMLHIINGGQACIYSYGQWQATAIHHVLQQRMVNHLASLLKIAAGIAPHQAFIGRIHHNHWTPEEP